MTDLKDLPHIKCETLVITSCKKCVTLHNFVIVEGQKHFLYFLFPRRDHYKSNVRENFYPFPCLVRLDYHIAQTDHDVLGKYQLLWEIFPLQFQEV